MGGRCTRFVVAASRRSRRNDAKVEQSAANPWELKSAAFCRKPLRLFCRSLALFDLGQSAPALRVRDWGMSEKPLIDPAQEKILSLAEETQFAPNGIVSRTLLNTAGTRVVLFGFAEGQELSEHTSTQHALIQILSGACEFSLAGRPHPMQAGDLLYMPPNLAHAVKATKPFSMLLTLFKPGGRSTS